MNDWVFDLQRFAEGEAPPDAAADSPADHEGEAAPESDAESAGAPSSVEDGAGGFAVKVDPVTGARTLVAIEGETESAEEEPTPTEPEQPVALSAYTADELLAAMTRGAVDETRIPENLQAQYISIRQQQQIAALQAQQQAAQQAMQPPVPEGQTPPTQQDADIYRRIQEAAETKAMQELGITQEQISELSYSDDPEEVKKAENYRVAVQMNVNAITREIDAYQAELRRQQEEAKAFATEFIPKMQQVQATEPNFNQIDLMMETYYRELPYNEAVQVEGAIQRFNAGVSTRADIPVLESYYNKTRAAFYAKKTGLAPTPQPAPKTVPPTVEGAGNVAPSSPAQVDWDSMRGMDVRERSEFLRAHLR